MTASKLNFDFVPSSYQELFDHYFKTGMVQKLMRSFLKFGTDEEFVTLQQDIFLRMQDKKVIEGFDPEKANFGGVVFFVTRTICTNHLDRKSRDPIGGLYGGSLVEETESEEDFTPGVYSLGRYSVSSENVEENVADRQLVNTLFAIAKKAMERNSNTRDRNLLPMLSLIAEEYTPAEVAEKLNVTQTTVTNWMKYLRSQLELV